MELSYLTPQREAAILDTIREAGKIMLTALDIENHVDAKPGTRNFVTAFDVKVQAFLEEKLHKIVPEAAFLGEEEEKHVFPMDRPCFVIDPIDGTTNFIHDFRVSCISVGIADRDESVWGAVWNPYTGDMFTGKKGAGAYLNGKPIHCTAHPLSDSLVSVGTSPYIRDVAGHETFVLAEKIFMASADVRRSGSAAWDLCLVACGRQDGFYEMILGPWDYCASDVILREAWAVLTRMDGRKISYKESCSALAGNPVCHPELLHITKNVHTPDQNM